MVKKMSALKGFTRILGQERPKMIFKNTLKNDRLAQSYLLAGPAGVGKESTAFEIAKTLNCLQRSDEDTEACDVCVSCMKIKKLQHPDILFKFPTPSSNTFKADDLAAVHKEYVKNTGKIITFNTAISIGIDVIKGLINEASFRVYEGKYKVVILRDVDLMTLAASNALLKLLEEPPQNMIFILMTSRVQALLPTILSRCQIIRFGFLDEASVIQILTTTYGIQPDQARFAATLSGGTVRGALDSLDEDLEVVREMAATLFTCVHKGDIVQTLKTCEALSRGRKMRLIERLLRMLAVYYRDMLMIKTGRHHQIAHRDKIEEIEQASKAVTCAHIAAAGETIERFRDMLARQVSPFLITFNLVQELRACMAGKRE